MTSQKAYSGFRLHGTDPMMSFRWGGSSKPPNLGALVRAIGPRNPVYINQLLL